MSVCERERLYLYQLLLSVLESTELALGALTELPEAVGLALGPADLVPHLLLQVLLLHRHRPVLLLGLLQPEGERERERERE